MQKKPKNPVVEKLKKQVLELKQEKDEYEKLYYRRDHELIDLSRRLKEKENEIELFEAGRREARFNMEHRLKEKDGEIERLTTIIDHLINKESVILDRRKDEITNGNEGAKMTPICNGHMGYGMNGTRPIMDEKCGF